MDKDQKILDELVGKKIPIEDFEMEICRIFRIKNGTKLICNNIPDTICDINGEFHKVNFRCIPDSPRWDNMFCLVLEHEGRMVLIKEGYLEKL